MPSLPIQSTAEAQDLVRFLRTLQPLGPRAAIWRSGSHAWARAEAHRSRRRRSRLRVSRRLPRSWRSSGGGRTAVARRRHGGQSKRKVTHERTLPKVLYHRYGEGRLVARIRRHHHGGRGDGFGQQCALCRGLYLSGRSGSACRDRHRALRPEGLPVHSPCCGHAGASTARGGQRRSNVAQHSPARAGEPRVEQVAAQGSAADPDGVGPAEFIAVKCACIRGCGYFVVLATPHAVSDSTGASAIGAPPGTYTVTAWHERFGTEPG